MTVQELRDAAADRRAAIETSPCGCYREADTGRWCGVLCLKGHDQ